MASDRQPDSARSGVMEITSPGNQTVVASFRGHSIATDQPVEAGGDGSAPAPFDIFLASIGTCALYYALRFCRQREIPTEGMTATLEPVRDPETRRLGLLRIGLRLPAGFPEKYRRAILRAMDQCAVKRQIAEPPEFELAIEASAAEEPAARSPATPGGSRAVTPS